MENTLTSKASLQKLTLTGLLVAVGVIAAPYSIPVGVAKAYPVQHAVNVVAGIMLGPWGAVTAAFLTSVIRNLLGWGTLLAFPGSMFGAFLAGLLFRFSRQKSWAAVGELLGTGLIGALASAPVARWLLGSATLAYTYIIPFTVSSAAGVILALVLVTVLERTGYFKNR